MTEREYLVISDLARVRAMMGILMNLYPDHIARNDYAIGNALSDLEKTLQAELDAFERENDGN